MRVVILGAGVIGITSAYYLSRAGAQVTVIDRQAGAAMETSFGNAGQVSPGYSTPWAAPGIPLKALKWMFQRHAPLAIRPDGSWHQLAWMAAMLRHCSPGRYVVNKERMLRLAEYSRDCLRQLRADTGIHYEHRTGGTLQLFRQDGQMRAAERDIEVLQACSVPYELLSRDALMQAEPALVHVKHTLAGGLRLPNDETGDCHLFTTRLAALAQAQGVQFCFGQNVRGLQTAGDCVRAVVLDNGERVQADQYVVAFGSYSRPFLSSTGLDLPVYPVKGYSLTIPVTDASRAPVSTVLDETHKVAVTRFDDRIRVGGMAELAGYDLRLHPRRRETLERVVDSLFPGAGAVSEAAFWTGLRPMTPDSTPIVGGTRVRNLFLNTGHGTLGWTMSCGSSQLLADLMCGRQTHIRSDDLALSRYNRPAPGQTRRHLASAA